MPERPAPAPAADPAAGRAAATRFALREARLDDAPAIARLHMACWAETYAGVLDAAFLAESTVERATAEWRGMLAAGSAERTVPGSRILLALDDGDELVGLARSAPAEEPDAVRPEKLDSLYTRARTHGTGLGALLLDGVLGDRPAYLWIVTANVRAERFYAKHGFALDGTGHPYAPWHDAHCSRMVR